MTVLSVMLVGTAQPEAPRVSAVVIVRAGGMQMLPQPLGLKQRTALCAPLGAMEQRQV